MIRTLWLAVLALCLGWLPAAAETAPIAWEAVFPYLLTERESEGIHADSTQLFYINVEHLHGEAESVRVTVDLPDGFTALPGDAWTIGSSGRDAQADWALPARYGQVFGVLSVAASEETRPGSYTARVTIEGDGWRQEKNVDFQVLPGEAVRDAEKQEKKLGWYIQNVVLPVDSDGNRDASQEKSTLYVRDVTLETIRSRLTGSGGVNWESILKEPVTYVLVEIRNPKKDSRSLHFAAELTDRESGEVRKGLVTAGAFGGDSGWAEDAAPPRTEAAIALDGKTVQGVVLPLYADPQAMEAGDYNLRTTISDGSTSRTIETPVTVVKKRNTGIAALSFALVCAAGVLLSLRRLRTCMLQIGAGGDIAVALFASLAFGSVVVPVTLFGDFLHVFLGPFAGLVTGLLSGVLQYLLFMALLVLFRRPGVGALFFLMKWLLAGILFGRFTPVAVLNYAVYIGILETALYAGGFYRKKEITPLYAAGISLLMGISDMAITFINLQQLMFFYRLYYADWFIGLYMVVNGLLYSSAGSWLGIRIGKRLQQVMGQ